MIHVITDNYFLALGLQHQLKKEELDVNISSPTNDVNVEFKNGDVIFLSINNYQLSQKIMEIASKENARIFYFCNSLGSNYVNKISKTCIISMRIHLNVLSLKVVSERTFVCIRTVMSSPPRLIT